MKFSFIRFFREELAWLKANNRAYYNWFVSCLQNGAVPFEMLYGDRLDKYRNTTSEDFLFAMIREHEDFVYYTEDREENSYLGLQPKAREILPKYIPELA